eukprot:m.201607 g.201607  ORF g.201607 m.201607 type:complete len:54 (-) comp21474_c0_seq1:1010-1171(-)
MQCKQREATMQCARIQKSQDNHRSTYHTLDHQTKMNVYGHDGSDTKRSTTYQW